jgi:ATP-binding cassette subfamily F protein uup
VAQEDRFAASTTVEQVLIEATSDLHLEEHERLTRAGIMLGKVGFADRHAMVDTLSGGWRKRLALARELIREPEVLLLDEPTNHLDLEGILWLEKTLQEAAFAFVLVSHDRYLLENTTRGLMEINRTYPQGYYRAAGNYSKFLERREEFLQTQSRQQETLSNLVQREIEWLRRGPKARTSKSQSRIDQAGRLIEDLAELKQRNTQGRTVDIAFSGSQRVANKLLVVEDLEKSFGGRKLFSRLSFSLTAGMRLGIVGANGSGKTTLLRLLTGEIEPDAGEIKQARRLSIVWFDQNRQQINREATLREALCPQGDSVVYRGKSVHVVAWAKRFLFATEQLDTLVGKLSGGEQARILIANLMLQPADILLLDEPTNDLDIPTLEVLEESLSDFPGALVLITHDRFMLQRLSTDVLGLDGRGNGRIFADYPQCEAAILQSKPADEDAPAKAAKPTRPVKEKAGKLSYHEQRELAQIEDRIMAAEAKVATVQQQLTEAAGRSDYKLLQAGAKELEEAQDAVNVLYQRWEELDAKRTSLSK